MKILNIVAGIILLFWAFTASAQERSLDIAATEWPPFYGADLEDNGFMTEIVREAFQRSGYTTDVSFLPWSRAFEGTREGRYDALFTMWYREDREADFIFSSPLPANELVFVVRAGEEFAFEGFDAIGDLRVGVVRGYAAPPGFLEAGLQISEARDDEENLRKLLRGRIDMVLSDRIVAQHIINTLMSDDAELFDLVSPPVHSDIQYLVVPRVAENAEGIMSAFNAAIAEMQEDGTLISIMASHGF